MTGLRHHAQPLYRCWDPDAGPHVHTALTMISRCKERASLCGKADDTPYEPWHLGDKERDSGPRGLLERPALEDTPQSSRTAPHIRKSQPPGQHLTAYHMVGSVSTSPLGCFTAQLASLLPQVAGSQNNWPSISREFSHTPQQPWGMWISN